MFICIDFAIVPESHYYIQGVACLEGYYVVTFVNDSALSVQGAHEAGAGISAAQASVDHAEEGAAAQAGA